MKSEFRILNPDFIEAACDGGGLDGSAHHDAETLHHFRGPRQLELGEVFWRQRAGAQLREVLRGVHEGQVVPRCGLRLDDIAGRKDARLDQAITGRPVLGCGKDVQPDVDFVPRRVDDF